MLTLHLGCFCSAGDDELIEAFTEEMENKPGFEDFRKAGQGLSPSMLKKWRLAGALYFTKAAFVSATLLVFLGSSS